MILRSFSSNQPYVLVSLPIAICAALLPSLVIQPLQQLALDLPLSQELAFLYQSSWKTGIVAIVLVLFGSWLSNAVFNKSEFFNTPTYVVALLYSFFACLFCIFQFNILVLIAGLMVLLGLERQLNIFKQARVLSLCFEAGFWFGGAALLYPPFLTLLVGAWIALFVNRSFNIREHLLLFIAFAMPFIYWIIYLYTWDILDRCVLFSIVASFDLNQQLMSTPWTLWYVTGIAVVGIIVGLPRYLAPADRAGNRTKMVKNTFLIMACAMLASIGIGYHFYHVWVLLSSLVIAVILLGYWFANYRFSLLAPFIFYGLLALGAIAVTNYYLW
jgi:hypothetical protein